MDRAGAAGGNLAARAVVACVFFALFFGWVWQWLDPRLLYHANQLCPELPLTFPVFFKGMAFFEPFALRCGGLAEYAAAFLSQYLYYQVVGALLLTGIAWLAYLVTDRLIVAAGGGGGARALRFVTPLLLLIIYNRYTFHLQDQVALLVTLALAVAYVSLSRRRTGLALLLLFPVFAALSAALYYAAGPPGVALLAVLCCLVELVGRRRYLLGLLYLLVAGGAVYQLHLDPKSIYDQLNAWWAGQPPAFDVMTVAATAGLYLFLALAVLIAAGRRRYQRPEAPANAGAAAPRRGHAVIIALALILLAGAAAAWGTRDERSRRILRLGHFGRMEMWSQLLDEAQHLPPGQFPAALTVELNRALFETGRLLDTMFAYPQPAWGHVQHPWMLLPVGAEAVRYRGSVELLLRLGCLNEAQRAADEALEALGPRPRVLREQALINLVGKQPEAARVYLTALSKDIVHGQWALNYLRRLDDDSLLAGDEQISRWRSFVAAADRASAPASSEATLLNLLDKNKKNRLACEYLLAYYLWSKKLDGVAANLHRLPDFGYQVLPEHVAEAVYIRANQTDAPVALHGMAQPPGTDQRVGDAVALLQSLPDDLPALARALAQDHSGSYVRYHMTGDSGVVP